MSNQHDKRAYSVPEDSLVEFSVRQLASLIWNAKWLVLSVGVLFSVFALIFALFSPDMYEADSLLVPNRESGGGGLDSLAAQYGGIASLAGININNGEVDRSDIAIETMKSRRFIYDFLEKYDILPELMAVDYWDSEKRLLVIDSKFFDIKSREWIKSPNGKRRLKPTNQEAYEEFDNRVAITRDNRTGFVRVSLRHQSPIVAQQWLSQLISELNETIRLKDIAQAKQSIDYLNRQVNITPLTEIREIFYGLIEQQTKKMMLASVSDEYVFEIIDPPIIAEEPINPHPVILMLIGGVLGLIIGVTLVLIRTAKTSLDSPGKTQD